MPDALVMNASSGLVNLSTQLPTVATIGGGGLVVLVLFAASLWMAHEFNRRNSWLRKLYDWVNDFAIGRAIVGLFTVGVFCGLGLFAQFFSSESGQQFGYGVVVVVVCIVCAFLGLVIIGEIFTPIYAWMLNYIFPNEPAPKRMVRPHPRRDRKNKEGMD